MQRRYVPTSRAGHLMSAQHSSFGTSFQRYDSARSCSPSTRAGIDRRRLGTSGHPVERQDRQAQNLCPAGHRSGIDRRAANPLGKNNETTANLMECLRLTERLARVVCDTANYEGDDMEGIITIRLLRRDLPPSGLTDLGFDANWLLKDLHKLPYTDKDGNVSTPIAEKYTIIECATSVKP
jgi:hypothetical protein